MRFPDLLVKVNELEYRLRSYETDLGYCVAQIQTIQRELKDVLPDSAKDLLVSRGTYTDPAIDDEEDDDDGYQAQLFT